MRIPEIVIGVFITLAIFLFLSLFDFGPMHGAWRSFSFLSAADRISFGVMTSTVLLTAVTSGLWYATQKLVNGANKTAEQQLRAYLIIESAEFHATNNKGGCHFRVVVKNYGKTPAYDCHGWIKFECIMTGQKFDYPKPTNIRTTGHHITGPSGTYEMIDRGYPSYSPGAITALVNGTEEVLGYGEITYKDIFGVRRITKYRYVVGGLYGIPEPPSAFTHSDGNEAT